MNGTHSLACRVTRSPRIHLHMRSGISTFVTNAHMRRKSLSLAVFSKKGKSKRGKFTKAQRDYISRCLEDGCAVCSILGMAGTPGHWHHCKEGWHGAGMRAPHEYGLVLCPWHHTDGPDSVHRNPKGFAALVGMTEAQLVDKMQRDYGWLSLQR